VPLRRVRILLAVFGVLGLVAVPAAVVSASGDPKPQALWESYPLDPAVAGKVHATEVAATRPAAQRGAEAKRGRATTVVPVASRRHVPATVKILLVGGAGVVGGGVGLIPAALLGMVLGVVPKPRRTPRRRRRRPMPAARPPARSGRPAAPARPAPAIRAPIVDPPDPPDPPTAGQPVAPAAAEVSAAAAAAANGGRDRHRELYDAEYAKQLHRVQALRRTITSQIAAPSSEPDQ
jgi:hypothetical protein